MNYIPNFKNLKNTLFCREKELIPLIEIHIDKGYKEKFLGKEIKNIEDEIDFSLKNNHDFILQSVGMLEPASVISLDNKKTGKQEKHWANEGNGVIKTIKDFEEYNWPVPLRNDYLAINKIKTKIPQNMGLIVTCGKIFTASWMLMGFENFCISLYENKNLIKKVIEKVGKIQYEYFKSIIDIGAADAIVAVDDIAYTEGLMISADILRENVFPWYEMMGKICKDLDIPFIYHSDGDIQEVLNDLITCGFNAIHPIEPKAMSITELAKKYKDSLCFLGNIELDTLTRGTPEDVKKLVKYNLENIVKDGFYACGSSNSVTEKVPIKNYSALIETVEEYNNKKI